MARLIGGPADGLEIDLAFAALKIVLPIVPQFEPVQELWCKVADERTKFRAAIYRRKSELEVSDCKSGYVFDGYQ
jgi:hypothetical protein